MLDNNLVLAPAWIKQQRGSKPSRTLLIGAVTLRCRRGLRSWYLEMEAHSCLAGDNPADTMLWLAKQISYQDRLILWRAEMQVVPALIAAAETAADPVAGAVLLRALDKVFAREVVDLAIAHGGVQSPILDTLAGDHGLPMVPMSKEQMEEAYRKACHGDVRQHLAAEAKAIWQLWLEGQPEEQEIRELTREWLTTLNAEVKP